MSEKTKYTPEEMVKIEKERTKNDVYLYERGAKPMFDKKGKVINV